MNENVNGLDDGVGDTFVSVERNCARLADLPRPNIGEIIDVGLYDPAQAINLALRQLQPLSTSIAARVAAQEIELAIRSNPPLEI